MEELNPEIEKRLKEGKNFKSFYFALYRVCLSNAWDLLDEAEILAKNQHYARAYFLAFTAAEEIGKALMVADWIYGLVSQEEFILAFRNHKVKLSYLESVFSAAHGEPERDQDALNQDVLRRMASLYVGKSNEDTPILPTDQVSEELALEMIDKVRNYLISILSAEWLNAPRIGTKALLK